jgi:citrate lyase subunit beta/citryl-CoA lyase
MSPDALVLDIEDSVPADYRFAARDNIRKTLPELGSAAVGAFVRLRAIDAGGLDDVAEIVAEGLTGVLLPKARCAQDVALLADALSYNEGKMGLQHGSISIMPIPETAEGMYDARTLAAASPRVKGLVTGYAGSMGGGDIVWAAGFEPSEEGIEQVFLTSNIALASRAGDAPYPIAGIIGTDMTDLGTVKVLIQRARRAGFTGVMLIHPSHVAIANAVYRPTETQIDFARGMIAAMAEAEAAGSGAVRYRGMMVDYANLLNAQRLIAEADRYGRNDA